MKGQAQIMATAAVVVVVVVMTLIGLTIYGLVSDVYPHEQTVHNETLCTTCENGSVTGTIYDFDIIPVLNDTTMLCWNDSTTLMTNGLNDLTCLGYNIIASQSLNITNSSADADCQIENVICTYTFDQSNALEQSFYDNNTSITFSGFALLSIAGIIIAAVAILLIILVLRG